MTTNRNYTNVSKDLWLHNLSLANKEVVPRYLTLPTLQETGSIVYNVLDGVFYGSDGTKWIPLSNNTGATTRAVPNIALAPSVAPGGTSTLNIDAITQAFGNNLPTVSGSGIALTPGVWQFSGQVRIISGGGGATAADAIVSILLDGVTVGSASRLSVSRNEPEVVIVEGFVNVISGPPNVLTFTLNNNAAAGADNLNGFIGWYVMLNRVQS